MRSTPEQQAPDPVLQLFEQLCESLDLLHVRIYDLEQQLRRIESNSDNAARELAEISRELWVNRSAATASR